MPKTCMSQTERLKLDPYKMKVYEILYEDCPRPWYVCRHETAEMSIEAIADNFGRLPVALRDFVRYQFGSSSTFMLLLNLLIDTYLQLLALEMVQLAAQSCK